MDADDRLGHESLERQYNFAIKNDSDVILGKYVGVGGRGVPKSMFKKGNIALILKKWTIFIQSVK
ncbi:hypothetical protein EFT49_11400 [Leuconostoc falkenbergense]|uniref:hypothetical protein n=1 Tax=Leuconostoc falkenbergense TaxID=2766470 RepID=UPI0021AAAA94|nr:hypothetical protein [Leuconostoc falkenbergense]MCT4420760.1 hypothetical protein [Leuconostoc falkenbergense]